MDLLKGCVLSQVSSGMYLSSFYTQTLVVRGMWSVSGSPPVWSVWNGVQWVPIGSGQIRVPLSEDQFGSRYEMSTRQGERVQINDVVLSSHLHQNRGLWRIPYIEPTVFNPSLTITVDHSSPVPMTICRMFRVLSGGLFLNRPGSTGVSFPTLRDRI